MASRKHQGRNRRLAGLDLDTGVRDERAYEKELARLQLRLLQIQQAFLRQKLRGVIVLEGWDTAGKGGLIRRMKAKLDPRQFHVWPIGAPTPEEQGRHYLRRFWLRLPAPGEICVFDRSWYGRVLVERVEKLATRDEWGRAYDEINEFEQMLLDDGVRLVKLFLHIDRKEQLKRFRERLDIAYKQWKLTAEDIRNHLHWDDYIEAAEDMFARTSTRHAPWHVIPANRKWYARLKGMETIDAALSRGIDLAPPPVDRRIAAAIEALEAGRPDRAAAVLRD